MNRPTSSRGSRAMALAAAAVLVLAACGSADDETGANAPTTSAAATTSAPVTTSATPTETPSATAAATKSATPTASPTRTPTRTKAPAKAKTTKAAKPKPKRTKQTTKAAAKPSLEVRSISAPDASGAVTIKVAGRNFDESKGIYVALCGKSGGMPSNCGGGVDTTGQGGASAWISSNPPGYAVGLPKPYQSGGRFTATLKLKPELGDGTDCTRNTCYVASRADHTRSSDRSQDVYVPVKFTKS